MMNMKKLLALLLAIVMVVGMIPFGAMAEEAEPTETTVATEATEVTEATVPATTEATVPETTEATVPETTEETVPETTEETVPETTEATVPETTEETVPETEPAIKELRGDANGINVRVSEGTFSADTQLIVRDVDLEEVNNVLNPPPIAMFSLRRMFAAPVEQTEENPTLDFGDQPYVALDISLENDNGTIQPDGSVQVTIDVPSDKFENGDDAVIYHVHVNEDGTATQEILGTETVENGKVTFEMDKFSYVIVLNSTVEIPNVYYFYPVSSYEESKTLPAAGNGQWYIVGVYFDTSAVAHLMIGSNGKMPDLNKIDYVTVNDHKYYNAGSKNNTTFPANATYGTFKEYDATITEIKLKDNTSNIVLMDISETNAGSLGGMLDIALDENIDISGEFSLSLKSNTGGDSQVNSFNINGLKVQLHLEYGIEKTVYSVGTVIINDENASVAAGDDVTFKIVVQNYSTSNINIDGSTLSDELPDCFDKTTAQWSTDSVNWSSSVIVPTIAPGGSETFYIKAQIISTLKVSEDTVYTNTASWNIPSQVAATDTATVTVLAPTTGNLKITKNVEKAYEGDNLPDDSFSFIVKNSAGDVVRDDISLSNGDFITLEELQEGTYTIIENLPVGSQYTSEYPNNTTTVTVVPEQTAEVAFTNTYAHQKGTLKIKKIVNKAYENDDLPDDDFEFTVTVNGDDNASYSYKVYNTIDDTEVDSETQKSITSGGTLTLKGGQYAVISDVPTGRYTVTETANTEYTTGKTGDVGTIVKDKEAIAEFTNTYTRHLYDMTISKTVTGGIYDADDTFIFEVYHGDKDNDNYSLMTTVTLQAGDSLTIKDVTLGDYYKVVEIGGGSNRYETTTIPEPKAITKITENNNFDFKNNLVKNQWLTATAVKQNVFGSASN